MNQAQIKTPAPPTDREPSNWASASSIAALLIAAAAERHKREKQRASK